MLSPERRQFEPASTSEGLFRSLLNAAPDAAVVIDDGGLIVLVNQQTETIFKYSREELIGQPVEVLLPERFRTPHVGHRRRYLADPHIRPMGAGLELAGLRSDGTEFPVDISLGSISIDDGRPLAMAFIRDISARHDAEAALAAAHLEVARRAAELEQRNDEIVLVSQMGTLLQSCTSRDEAFDVIARFAQRLFAAVSGEVFLAKSGDLLESVARWGSPASSMSVFRADDCWALRRGLPHRGGDTGLQPRCVHVDAYRGEYICVPMIAQNQSMGVVHLRQAGSASPSSARDWNSTAYLAIAMAEHIALALANLNLRETLKRQSIRDPLTNLFNRRFLDEYLERELLRAARSHSPVSVIMLDVDHFKSFNDEYGHAIGDSVLINLARLLQSIVRGGDVACRYGGEEFVVILPDSAVEGAAKRAEEIRMAASHMETAASNSPISVSIGVAECPTHAVTPIDLMQAADNALYLAKLQGRNRVVVQTADQLQADARLDTWSGKSARPREPGLTA